MFPSRPSVVQSAAARKSKLDGKQSFIPKPRRTASNDRVSDACRGSMVRSSGALRSSSAEPSRNMGGPRLSREASASKAPNRRSRSHQERYGGGGGAAGPGGGSSLAVTTPLRSSNYPRTTSTPRTPSEDRFSRSWPSAVERALAFVTVKDQRQISVSSWQRVEAFRVQAGLAARGLEGALLRPLTITRFVEVVGALLTAATIEVKLNNDNYVAKLPNIAKRFLYPGVVSKSWLKTVNTLHAFPHALALIAYFMDLADHISSPVLGEWLYVTQDELSRLRRELLQRCWVLFQEPEHSFQELDAQYLSRVRDLMQDDQNRLAHLTNTVKQHEAALEDSAEAAERAAEDRLRARVDAASASLRDARARRHALLAERDQRAHAVADKSNALRALQTENDKLTAEIDQLSGELCAQTVSVSERARLLEEVDYATRVIDSKRTLAEQISKMVLQKETEVSLWQRRALESCTEYKQHLVALAASVPHLAALAVDETELRSSSCAEAVSRAVATLRAHVQHLADERAARARSRRAQDRQRTEMEEEACARIAELKVSIDREQQAVECEQAREAADAASWAAASERIGRQLAELADTERRYMEAQDLLNYWQEQDSRWRTKLSELQKYVESVRERTEREVRAHKRASADSVTAAVSELRGALQRADTDHVAHAQHMIHKLHIHK